MCLEESERPSAEALLEDTTLAKMIGSTDYKEESLVMCVDKEQCLHHHRQSSQAFTSREASKDLSGRISLFKQVRH
jgi:hypothetical protein